ncbi:MAG: ATP-binding protein [Crenarchaeota archaeon]|nr:ATP-binding protein [Thermoproteota archaeon]
MRHRFVDRALELRTLERVWRGEGPRLVIVYGRRRVGKTRLLKEFSRGKQTLFFVAIEAPKRVLYTELSKLVEELVGRPVGVLEGIDRVLELVASEVERPLVIIDEFQYLVDADPEAPSRIQRFVDQRPEADVMIVLCGSAVSFFERELLGYRSPLFGRRAAAVRLRPMRLVEAWGFYPRYGALDAVRVYSAFGGTPAYASAVDDSISVVSNIARSILDPSSYLFHEAIDFLRQELREPSTYVAILSAVARGYTRPSEVASIASVSQKTVSKYIDVLEHLDILERLRSMGRRRGEVQLEIIDPYFRFWFTFVKPHLSHLEAGLVEDVASIVSESLDEYTARVFETVVRRELAPYIARELGIELGEVGKWWHKGEEIDVVIRGRRQAAFIEVKWSDLDRVELARIARDLEGKASSSGLQRSENTYIVVARRIEGCSPLCVEKPYAGVSAEGFLEKLRIEAQPHA